MEKFTFFDIFNRISAVLCPIDAKLSQNIPFILLMNQQGFQIFWMHCYQTSVPIIFASYQKVHHLKFS